MKGFAIPLKEAQNHGYAFTFQYESSISDSLSLSHAPYRLYVTWRFLRGMEAQFLALQKGFNEVISQHLLKAFDEKELEV